MEQRRRKRENPFKPQNALLTLDLSSCPDLIFLLGSSFLKTPPSELENPHSENPVGTLLSSCCATDLSSRPHGHFSRLQKPTLTLVDQKAVHFAVSYEEDDRAVSLLAAYELEWWKSVFY